MSRYRPDPRLRGTILDPVLLSDESLAKVIVEAVDLLRLRGRTALAKEVIAGEAEDLQIETVFSSRDGTAQVLKMLEAEIKRVTAEILALDFFTKGCAGKKCRYCNLALIRSNEGIIKV